MVNVSNATQASLCGCWEHCVNVESIVWILTVCLDVMWMWMLKVFCGCGEYSGCCSTAWMVRA